MFVCAGAINIPSDQPITKLKNLDDVAVPTMEIKVNKICFIPQSLCSHVNEINVSGTENQRNCSLKSNSYYFCFNT